MWLKAPNIQCTHGFSTRHGGISPAPFNSLNLGGSQDDPLNISINRQSALQELNVPAENLCTLKQVHGVEVCLAKPGAQQGDALVTNNKNHVLAVSMADCYPVLLYDDVNKVIGAAHAGWRGTLGKIAGHAVQAMLQLGAQAEHIKVAIGQGISGPRFEVGVEIIQQFREEGFPENCFLSPNRIDLVQCNLYVLRHNNILEKNIWHMNRCTFEPDFFSYRRDKGITGRMWAVIAMH